MNVLIPIIVAMLTTLIATPIVILLAHKLNLVDNAKTRFHPAHTHKGIIPRAGGLALFTGLILAVVCFLL